MRQVNNAARGCGTLKKGGYYLQGTPARNGGLRAWTWFLGTGLMTDSGKADQPMITCAPRSMELFSLPASLMAGQKVEYLDRDKVPDMTRDFPGLKKMAVLDHVGKSHYPNPLAFSCETEIRGPSRRITPEFARAIAPYVPIPIIFTHDNMPFARDLFHLHHGVIPGMGETLRSVATRPTWTQPGFSMAKGSLTTLADKHWIIKALNNQIYDELLKSETLFGGSWITDVVFIDDGEADLRPIMEAGIEPVTID